jgi:polar amino acid transport system substrate-binding protein
MNNMLIFLIAMLGLIVVAIVYVTKQRHAKIRLSNTAHHLFSLLSISKDAIMLLEENNTVTYMNDAMATLLQVNNEEKQLLESDMPKVHSKGAQHQFNDFIKEEYVPNQDEFLYYSKIQIESRKLGMITVDLYLGKTYVLEDKTEQFIIVMRDLREAIKESASDERDPLTRLPNRAKAHHDFQVMCSKHHIKENKIALMALGIDDFQATLSLLGHEKADKAILAVTHALKELTILHGYRLYHMTYANFLLIFPKCRSLNDLHSVAQTIQTSITKLHEEHKSPAYLTASIGIATSPESGAVTDLFKKANQALIDARKYGVGNAHLYTASESQHGYDESELQRDIQHAIKREELVIYYQPIIDARTRKIAAVEALMRWRHPAHGFIPPVVFIPLMEKSGFIIDAGRYLIREVVHQQAKWKMFGYEEIVISLNASMREIETKDYLDYLTKQLREYNVRPDMIKIEITESLAMNNSDKISKTFAQLRGAGVPLSLDDFGSGYTSFSYLTKVPANTLKIDKSFIDNILEDKKNQQVVHAIIEVGHALEMDIVAEGVETADAAKMLIGFGCDYLQGYYFSKPVPVFEIQGQLRRKNEPSGSDHQSGGHSSDILPIHPL